MRDISKACKKDGGMHSAGSWRRPGSHDYLYLWGHWNDLECPRLEAVLAVPLLAVVVGETRGPAED